MKNNDCLIIQGWMMNRLKLKGTELIIYAAIYNFSQDGNSVFSGTLANLSDLTGVSKQSICNTLKKLVKKEFIIKIDKKINGVQFFDYKANLAIIEKNVL